MLIFWSLVFLLLTAFFAASEIAFITANKLAIEVKKSRGSSVGKILANFYEKPEDFISVMLVGINVCLVVLSYLLTDLLSGFLENINASEATILLINTSVVTLIILVFGEFVPKALARLYSNATLNIFCYPLLFFYKLFGVPAKFLTGLSNWMIDFFLKGKTVKTRHRFSALDLEHYVDGPMHSQDEKIDSDIFKNALHLNQIKVKNCMIPRNEIVYIDINQSVADLKATFSASKLSKVIVIDDDIDNVLGYIHHQKLLRDFKNIREMVIELPYIPETMNVYDLMIRMNKLRISIACVVDEFGGTSGIITQEDILEEIFGEIEDEHDQEEFIDEKLSEDEFLFSGRLELNYLNDAYNLSFPEGEFHTLSGFLVMSTGKIPEQGEEVILDNYKFIMELVSDTRIETVRLFKLNGDQFNAQVDR